ncbi:Glutamate receptor ionotropic, delta-1, partial [Armadillidium nasatum]
MAIWIFASLSLAFASTPELKRSYGIYFFILFGALTNQGCEIVPSGIQGRIIFITFFLMCVVLYATYTALITTHFTIESYRPINSLREALDSGFRITVVRGTFQHEIFLEVNSEENIEIRKTFQENPYLLPSTPEEAIENTYDKMTLFVYDGSVLQSVISDNCSLRLQPPSLFQGFEHLPIVKGFKFKEIFNRRIVRLMATGNMKKLAMKWYDKNQNCLPPANV